MNPWTVAQVLPKISSSGAVLPPGLNFGDILDAIALIMGLSSYCLNLAINASVSKHRSMDIRSGTPSVGMCSEPRYLIKFGFNASAHL